MTSSHSQVYFFSFLAIFYFFYLKKILKEAGMADMSSGHSQVFFSQGKLGKQERYMWVSGHSQVHFIVGGGGGGNCLFFS